MSLQEETKLFNVAVVGATGNVGREILSILEERKFPIKELYLLASSRSAGSTVPFCGREVVVRDLAEFDFSRVQIGLFSPGASVSSVYAPKAAAAGCVVVDNTSFFRMDPEVPLVVPEVNPEAIAQYVNKGIIANPNCSTIQMVVALKPLHDAAVIRRVVVSTYQAVSGAGKEAMDELFEQTRSIYATTLRVPPKKFSREIAFNVIPQIDVFLDNGYTKEEMKMINETKKILDPAIRLTATTVRVPVFNGHSVAVNVEFEKPLSVAQARELLANAPGVKLVDDPKNAIYPLPVNASGSYDVLVGRLRKDQSCDNGLVLWCAGDNIWKGAAQNAIQIAEEMIRMGLK